VGLGRVGWCRISSTHQSKLRQDLLNWAVASLVESRVSAVRSINGIEEVVQETIVSVVGLGWLIVGLEQNRHTWVDERDGDGKIQDRLQTSYRLGNRAGSTVDSVLIRTEALGDVQAGLLVKLVEVLLVPDIVDILEDSELAGTGGVDGGVGRSRHVVQSSNTLRSNVDVAQGEVLGINGCIGGVLKVRELGGNRALDGGKTEGFTLLQFTLLDVAGGGLDGGVLHELGQLDSRSNVVDVLGKVLRDVVPA